VYSTKKQNQKKKKSEARAAVLRRAHYRKFSDNVFTDIYIYFPIYIYIYIYIPIHTGARAAVLRRAEEGAGGHAAGKLLSTDIYIYTDIFKDIYRYEYRAHTDFFLLIF
jgi:hypothetical protein